MAKKYGNDSISSLKGADRVRKRPSVIFGSDGLTGCEHAVFEILSNSIDEARAGYGDVIKVTRFLDHSVEVEDFGRGCPVDWNEREQKYNWELVFCELYAGGKYENNYDFALGLNGLGSCATQYSSEYMDVRVRRDGYEYKLHFEKGELAGKMKKKAYKGQSGTCIRWLPDLEVFTDIRIPIDYFTDVLRRQAVVNPNIKFQFFNETAPEQFEETEFYYENGILDYVQELSDGEFLSEPVFWQAEKKGRDRADKDDYRVKLSVAWCISNKIPTEKAGMVIQYYHNSSWLEHGGAPEKATKSAFVAAFDKYMRENGKYQKNESKITWADIEDCLILVSSNFSTQTSYENQTKKAITNQFVQEAMTAFLKANLEIFFKENPQETQRIVEQILINKRSRERAESTRLNVRKKLSGNIDIANRVQKFVDCRTKDVSRREIYIVEGDSALGSVKLARDSEFQGIMPIRGKILNCLKADYNRIFKSDIIIDLMKVLGCGVEISGKKTKELSSFDLNNLRWSKVIFCTDGDVDGFQIRTLLLTMIYRLAPTLIQKGYIYIAETPLFEINCGNDTWFAYSDQEKANILKKLEGSKKKIKVDRSKGLGENDPDMMWMTTMDPETRRLIKVTPSDAEETARVFDLLLGDNLQGRKDHIAEAGNQYLEMLDLS